MKKLILAAIAMSAAMSAAQAQTVQGGYVGLGVSTSRFNFGVNGASSSDDTSGNKVGGKIFGGVNLDKNWGVELGYADLGSAKYGYSANALPGSLDTDPSAWYLAGKGMLPLSEQFSLTGKLGVSRLHNKLDTTGVASALGSTSNKTDAYVSLGGEYALSKQVALSLEWERYGQNANYGTKASAVTLAARYNF